MTVKVIRGGQTWTSDPVVAKINPVAVAINVNSDTKVYNADDPVFSGTVSKLVSESDLGEITYGRLAADASKENVGDDITLTAFYTENDNYNVTVINGKLVITPSDENAIVATGITKTYDGGLRPSLRMLPSLIPPLNTLSMGRAGRPLIRSSSTLEPTRCR